MAFPYLRVDTCNWAKFYYFWLLSLVSVHSIYQVLDKKVEEFSALLHLPPHFHLLASSLSRGVIWMVTLLILYKVLRIPVAPNLSGQRLASCGMFFSDVRASALPSPSTSSHSSGCCQAPWDGVRASAARFPGQCPCFGIQNQRRGLVWCQHLSYC